MKHSPQPLASHDDALPQIEQSVSRETLERLRIYAQLVERWSPRINLVSRADLPHVWERHILDALQIVPHIPPELSHAIDLGSGGGFPGLVLAIATTTPFHLVESDRRKASFLREAARATGTHVTIHADRIENTQIPQAPLITARALAALPKLLDLAVPLLAPGGMCLFPKGQNAGIELTAAEQEWHMQVECVPSRTQSHSCLLKIREPRRAKIT